jgi:hypothetical protein
MVAPVVGIIALLVWGGKEEYLDPARYYDGVGVTTATATTGALRTRVRRATYADTTWLYVDVTNGSAATLWLNRATGGGWPAYYLLDEKGRRYPQQGKGLGWKYEAGDPPDSLGRIPPGRTGEFNDIYPPVPRDVRHLTLVVEGVTDDRGHSYDLRAPVPLPKES